MSGAKTIRHVLSISIAIAAAVAILLISQSAQAFDRPAPLATDNQESAPQATDQDRVTALVSDHLYRSLLSYEAENGCGLFPACGSARISNIAVGGGLSDSPLVSATGLRQLGLLPAAAGFRMIERPPALPGATAVDLAIEPDSGGPGQRSRKANLAPGISPMSTSGKFNYFLRKSFMPPWPYAMSILGGVVSQAIDTKDKKHRENAGEFMVGSLEHAARSFAFRTTANFFEKFAYASLFKQDPRYHPSENKGFGSRLGYAVSRVFVTQGDHGGSQFNASFLLGGLTAAGISNAWEQDKHVNVQDTFKRWGTHIGITALTNVLHELFRR